MVGEDILLELQWLRQAAERMAQAMENQIYPLERIADALNYELNVNVKVEK